MGIGLGGLWNGLVIRIFMIGTLTSLRKSNVDSLACRNADEVIRMGYLRQLQDLHGFSDHGWRRSIAQADRSSIDVEWEDRYIGGACAYLEGFKNCRLEIQA